MRKKGNDYGRSSCGRESNKKSVKKYRQTAKGKATRQKHYQDNKEEILKKNKKWREDNPEKNMIIKREYAKNPHAKELSKIRLKKFYQTPKGKEAAIRNSAKRRRNLSWVKLFNNPFPDEVEINWHHINDMLVVPLPVESHLKSYHPDVSEHRERANLWMFYLYGCDFDLLLGGVK